MRHVFRSNSGFGIQAQGMESADNRDVDDDISSENDVGTAATHSRRLGGTAFAQPIVFAWYPETPGDEFRMDHFSLFPSSEMIAASLSRKTQHVRFVRVADFELMKELLEMAETQQSERERHVLAYDSEVAEGEASEVDTGGGQRTMGRIPAAALI